MTNDTTTVRAGGAPQRFWQFRAEADAPTAELLLYGPISDTTWWGDEVTPALFAQELAALGNVQQLMVRIFSYGGDPFAALAIRALLDTHPAQLIVRIDGAAASAATLIAPLRATVIMPSNSAILVHHPMASGFIAMNAEQMRQYASELDAMSDTIVNAYQERTGMTREEIAALMDEDRWMYAAEAVGKGFADQLEQARMAACVHGDQLMVNGVGLELERFHGLQVDAIAEDSAAETDPAGTVALSTTDAEGDTVTYLTAIGCSVEMLARDCPELLAEIRTAARDEGVHAERTRQTALDELVADGTADIVSKARTSGLSPEACSLEIVRAMKASGKGAAFLAARRQDAEESNVNNVAANVANTGGSDDAERARIIGLAAANTKKEKTNG
jgi:ATP-dependent protease ClpP protease subunit